jgi:flagellar motor switch protein FliN/FliY
MSQDPSATEAARQANESDLKAWRDFMDLPVPLTVELGRTQLTARAILALEVNSLIQLSRSTGEGVDVLAGEHCVTRGEILMIEDRTGVRITHVVVHED